MAPFILFLFNLFIYFFKQEMFVKFLFALNGDRLSNWTYSTPMPKVEGDWDKSEDWVTTRTERSTEIGNFQQYYMSSWSIKRLLMIYRFKKFRTHANQRGILAVHLTFEEERELLRKASTSGNKNDSFGRRRLDIVK